MKYFQATTDGKVHERPVREGFLLQFYVCGLELSGDDENHDGPASCGKCKKRPATATTGPVTTTAGSNVTITRHPETLPGGYNRSGGQGGYYTLKGPDGEIIVGPSKGKWQGKDGTALAAWEHFE